MYGIYAYIGVVWGVNVGIYGSPMERLGNYIILYQRSKYSEVSRSSRSPLRIHA